MEGKWRGYDWVIFVIRLIVFISVLHNASVAQEKLTIPYWIVLLLAGISYIVPFILLLRSRTAYFYAEIFFLGALTPVFSMADATLVGNFISYSLMIGFYQDQKIKRWSIPLTLAVLLLAPIPSLFSNLISYISVLISGFVFYGLGLMFHHLIQSKLEIQRKNEIIEQQYAALEQYAKQVEQTAVLQERNRISTAMQHSVSHTFASLIIKMEMVQKKLEESHISDLIEITHKGMKEVQDAIHQLEGLDVEISVKDTMMNIVDHVRQNNPIMMEFVVKGEEPAVSKQTLHLISRCLQELLINAINIGKAEMLLVTLQFGKDYLELRLEDDGTGSEQERIRDGLSKLTDSLTLIKGEFSLTSFLNKGHTATVKVPIIEEEEKDLLKLLVVDSNRLVRESLIHLFELQGGMKVVGHGESAEEAIRHCESQKPDVILVDSNQENGSGIQPTLRLKQIYPNAKIIILSNHDLVEEAIEAIHAGAEGYVSKNIPLRELTSKLRLVHLGERIISQSVAKQLIEQMLHTDQTKVRQERWQQEHGLTDREIEVLRCLADGLKYKEISEMLFLAEGTVRNYISTIYSKLEVRDRKQAAQKAVQGGIL